MDDITDTSDFPQVESDADHVNPTGITAVTPPQGDIVCGLYGYYCREPPTQENIGYISPVSGQRGTGRVSLTHTAVDSVPQDNADRVSPVKSFRSAEARDELVLLVELMNTTRPQGCRRN